MNVNDRQAKLRRMRRSLYLQCVLLIVLIGGVVVYLYSVTGQPTRSFAWDDTRNLDFPSGRLVGHWEMVSEVPQDVQQLYFAAPDAEGKGATFLVLASGVTQEMEYRITREARSGLQLDFDCFMGGDRLIRSVKMSIPEDGQTASYEFEYFGQRQKRHLKYRGPQISP